MTETIELVGPCFADGKRVRVQELPDAYYAVCDWEKIRIQDAPRYFKSGARIARFHRTDRTHQGARVYEFSKQWGGD